MNSTLKTSSSPSSVFSVQLLTIFVCFLMNMLDGMDVMVVSYAAPNISKDWSVSPQSLGVVFSAGLLGMAIGAIFLASRADKIGRKGIILISNVLMSVSVFATAWANSVEMLTIMRVVSGIGIGGMLASTATLTSENAPQKTKDFWVSFVMAGYPIGAVLSGLVAASVIPQYGWPAIFKIAGFASFVTLPIGYFFLKESKEFLNKSASRERPALTALLAEKYKKATIGLWVAIFMAFATLYFLTTWIPKLASVTGLSVELAIYAGTVFNLGAFFGIISQGYLSSIFGLQKTIFGYLIFTAFLMLIFGQFAGSVMVLVLFGLIGFGIQGGFVGMYSLAARLYPTEIRATGVGGAVGIGRIGAIVGPLLGGVLIGAGLSMTTNFIVFAVPTVISGIAMLYISTKDSR
ncbi:MFS transporter [Emticicia sp. SJ17W-69]|uniref:MFS transporter n=1 Tax=Emticicia sp. SJ17W-69 TaxID=3421657 RepID=UPI003EBEB6CB